MMIRDEILEILRRSREELRRDFGVESMALFGSAARGDAGPSSDVGTRCILIALRSELPRQCRNAKQILVRIDSSNDPLSTSGRDEGMPAIIAIERLSLAREE